jgi:hypothetical protein
MENRCLLALCLVIGVPLGLTTAQVTLEFFGIDVPPLPNGYEQNRSPQVAKLERQRLIGLATGAVGGAFAGLLSRDFLMRLARRPKMLR